MMKPMRRPGFFRALSLLAVATGLTLGIWAFVLEPASLAARHHPLDLPKWLAGLRGLKVAVLADLHVGAPYVDLEKLARIVRMTNELQPDLVLIPGDLVVDGVLGGRFVAPEDSAAVLAGLSAPLGVWATLGNHDWWLGAPRVRAALEKRGIRVLEDEAARIGHGGTHFWLVGISDFWEGRHDVRKALSAVADDAPIVAFTHNPDVFVDLPARVSLLVAGHTHGGQVRFPLLGAPIVPSRYGQRFLQGHIVENGRHLFVSSGIGTSILPVRFRAPPEISVLELN